MGVLYSKVRRKLKEFIYLKGIGSIFDLGGASWIDLFLVPKSSRKHEEDALSEDYKKLTQDLSSSLHRTISFLDTTLSKETL